ncbi:hypothetical protein FQN50_005856 [Emmonsiellopsis sp. PD_5]|nr:hypothetical protein FQN50_005856 [Emmonsiellopsis sp. PD_5]
MADSQPPPSNSVPPPPQTPATPTPAAAAVQPPSSATPNPPGAELSSQPENHDTSTSTVRADDTEMNTRPDVTMGGTAEASAAAAANNTASSNQQTTTGSGSGATMGAAGAAGLTDNNVNPVAPTSALPPSKKDTSLREFLGQMDEYAPIIPDAVTAHYLTLAGLPPPGNGPNQTPPHLARLLALATQKFIADIAADAYQYSRIRSSNSSSSNNPMGNLAATGLAAAGTQAAAGAGGAGGGVGGGGAGGGAAGGGGGGGEGGKGKGAAATGGLHLGVQRPGFGGGGQGGQQGRTVLTMEDLGMAVSEYGVTVKRGEFYR